MTRTLLLIPLLFLAGCSKPLPDRLLPEDQARVENGWNLAFAPVNRLDHQGLLDLMVAARIYEHGVDFLEMKSEKRFAGGKAVMEVHYERDRPEADRFTVTIFDRTGKLLRSDAFDRREVEGTVHDLLGIGADGRAQLNPADRAARWNRVREVFPEPPK